MSETVHDQRTRLKKRIGFYRGHSIHYVKLMESDFRGIFSKILNQKKPNYKLEEYWVEVIEMINNLTEKECLDLNLKLDCYQIEEKRGKV